MSLTRIDSQNFICISRTKESAEVDNESGYDHWRRLHPPIPWESSVNPTGSLFCFWTFLVSLAVTYNFFTIPFYVFLFGDESKFYWQLGNFLVDVIYLLDILVKSRLRFIKNGCEESLPQATIARYCRKYLLVDAVSVFPTEIFFFVAPCLPLLRLNRLFRFNRLLDLFHLLEHHLDPMAVAVSRVIFLSFLVFHWNASGYFTISSLQPLEINEDTVPKLDRWPCVPEKITDFWVFKFTEKSSNRTRHKFGEGVKNYVQSFYWSCMTVLALGEQPSPENTTEMVFELVDTLLGAAVFSAILGTVGILVGNCNRRQSERRSLMDTLKSLMDFRQVEEDMRDRVLRYFARDTFIAEERTDLPDLYYLASNRFAALLPLAKTPLFHGTGHSFLTDLGRQLVFYSLGPGDVLARAGEEQREMFIVVEGSLICEDGKGGKKIVREGNTIGANGLLRMQSHPMAIYSQGYSQVYALKREQLSLLLEDYPHLKGRFYPQAESTSFEGRRLRRQSIRENTTEAVQILEELEADLDRQYRHFVRSSAEMKKRLFSMEKELLQLSKNKQFI